MGLPANLYKPKQGWLSIPVVAAEIPDWQKRVDVLDDRLDKAIAERKGSPKGTPRRKELDRERQQIERDLSAACRELHPRQIIHALSLEPADENASGLSGDELDAILCALPGVLDDNQRLEDTNHDPALSRKILERLRKRSGMTDYDGPHGAPAGYVLARSRPTIASTKVHIVDDNTFREMLRNCDDSYLSQ